MGYYRLFVECLVCDYLLGLFLVKLIFLKSIGLDVRGINGFYRDLFLWVKEKYLDIYLGFGYERGMVVSCLDVMFYM